MTKKAILFLRVSTAKQTLEQQQATMMKEALAHYSDDEIIIIQGKESASKLDKEERKTLTDLFFAIEQNPTIERVYFFAVDRLARKASTVISVTDELAEKGIDCYFHNPFQLHTLTPDSKRNPIADMMLYFLGKGAEMENTLKSERIEAKRVLMKANGQVATGNVAYGYIKNKSTKMIEVNEETAQYVRMMFNMYASGEHSLKSIAYKMMELGVIDSTKKATLSADIIRQRLVNPLYSGRKPTKGNNKYPPIVSVELQDKVIEMLHNNLNKAKKTHKYIYFGKKLIRSTVSQHIMTPVKSSMTYRTNRDDDNQICVSINAVDFIIWENTVSNMGVIKALQRKDSNKKYEILISKNEKSIKRLSGMIEDTEKEYKKLYKAYRNGVVPYEEYEKDVKDLQGKQNEYKRNIATLETEIEQYKHEMAPVIPHEQDAPLTVHNYALETAKYDDSTKKKLIDFYWKSVNVSRLENGHFWFEFESNYIDGLEFSYEYWVSGGVMHLYQCREVQNLDTSELSGKDVFNENYIIYDVFNDKSTFILEKDGKVYHCHDISKSITKRFTRHYQK